MVSTIPPQKLREAVFQLLFSLVHHSDNIDELLSWLPGELKVRQEDLRVAYKKVLTIINVQQELDRYIETYAKEYALDRIPQTERNILRLAFFELIYDPSIPAKVVIAEAIRLTRKFSTPQAAHFVNALLDAAYKGGVGGRTHSEEGTT